MSSGGSGGGDVTQKTEPWEGQKPYLQEIFSEAQKQYQAGGPQYYPGQTVVPYSPQEQTAQQQLERYAMTDARRQSGEAQAAQSFLLGPALFADTNPALRAAAQGAISPIAERLHEQTLPQIDQGAVLAGGYGGSRHGIAQAQAIDKATENMLATTADLYSRGYGQGLDAMKAGMAFSPQTMRLGTDPMQMLASSGEMDRALAEALLEDDMRRWEFAQSVPATKLAQYQNLVQGTYGGTGSRTAPGPSRLMSALGGGLSGYALGSSLGPALGGGAMWGPAGAALGGLAGLFLS